MPSCPWRRLLRSLTMLSEDTRASRVYCWAAPRARRGASRRHPCRCASCQLLNSSCGTELAIDPFIVAVADLAGGAVFATVKLSDLELLSSDASNVVIADIGR